jgi:hypothetical protein
MSGLVGLLKGFPGKPSHPPLTDASIVRLHALIPGRAAADFRKRPALAESNPA